MKTAGQANLTRCFHFPNPMKKSRAFTLVEVIVVVSIIALLSAILLPVFNRARDMGKRASCQSNLKQIAIAIESYKQDNSGFYPGLCVDGNSDNLCNLGDYGWASHILPYTKSSQIYQCPTESLSAGGEQTSRFTDYYLNYAFSELENRNILESTLTFPANSILVGDGDGNSGVSFYTFNGGSGVPANALLAQSGAGRHSDGANYLFCDGHVKWLKPDAISGENVAPNGKNFTFGIK